VGRLALYPHRRRHDFVAQHEELVPGLIALYCGFAELVYDQRNTPDEAVRESGLTYRRSEYAVFNRIRGPGCKNSISGPQGAEAQLGWFCSGEPRRPKREVRLLRRDLSLRLLKPTLRF
jgi:hypothetical protein